MKEGKKDLQVLNAIKNKMLLRVAAVINLLQEYVNYFKIACNNSKKNRKRFGRIIVIRSGDVAWKRTTRHLSMTGSFIQLINYG